MCGRDWEYRNRYKNIRWHPVSYKRNGTQYPPPIFRDVEIENEHKKKMRTEYMNFEERRKLKWLGIDS